MLAWVDQHVHTRLQLRVLLAPPLCVSLSPVAPSPLFAVLVRAVPPTLVPFLHVDLQQGLLALLP